jgi:cytochrome c oxidase assembly protein subunit 11
MSKAASTYRANRRTATKLALVAVAMFGFGYVLASFYDEICRAVGIGGKTDRIEAQAVGPYVDQSRTVTVEFTGNAATGLPWEFRPLTKRLDVHPGQTIEVRYYVRNTAGEAITGQAIPSVTPGRAAAHFKKIECFCFTQQQLKAGEAREMLVRFVVSPEVASDVHTITLSYAFFNADKLSAAKYGGVVAPEHHHPGPHAHTDGKG